MSNETPNPAPETPETPETPATAPARVEFAQAFEALGRLSAGNATPQDHATLAEYHRRLGHDAEARREFAQAASTARAEAKLNKARAGREMTLSTNNAVDPEIEETLARIGAKVRR
jgi:hypothetical protein